MRLERTIAVLVLATGVMCAGAVLAASQEGESKPAAPPAAETEDPKLPPTVKNKLGFNPWVPVAVKPEHAVLAAMTGKFTTKVHVAKGPYARMNDTEGTAEGKSLMGGAFVQLTHSELRMKQPFEAMTIYGFDQAIRKYTASSIDNNSTAIVTAIGTYDASKKQLVMSGRFSDQQTRKLTIVRTVMTFVDADNWNYEEYVSEKLNGPETPRVAIAFKRS